VTNLFISILNSPYEHPKRHWELDESGPAQVKQNPEVQSIYENSRYVVLRQDVPATDSWGRRIRDVLVGPEHAAVEPYPCRSQGGHGQPLSPLDHAGGGLDLSLRIPPWPRSPTGGSGGV